MTDNSNRKHMWRAAAAAAAMVVLTAGLAPSVARADDVPNVCQPVPGYNDKCPRWAKHVEGPVSYVFKSTAQAVSPVGDQVYVTGVDNGHDRTLNEGDWVTAAFDQATGVRSWVARYASELTLPDVPHDIAVSPNGRQVFVTGVSGRSEPGDLVTIAYSAKTGARLWKAVEAKAGIVFSSSPVAVSLDGARVYAQGAKAVAYDAMTGAKIWEATAPGEPVSVGVSPDGSRLHSLVKSATGSVATAYDATTGSQLWSAAGSFSPAALGVDGSRVYVAGSTSASGTGDYVTVAYDATTGSQAWTAAYNAGAYDAATDLAVAGGRVYVTGATSEQPQEDNTGTAVSTADYATVAYDAATGAQHWAARYGSVVDGTPGSDRAAAVAASPDGNGLYVTGRSERPLGAQTLSQDLGPADATTVAYDPATGVQRWVGRYNGSPTQSDFAGGLAVGVSPDSHRVFTTASLLHASDAGTEYAVMAHDAYADSPAPTSTPAPDPAPRAPTDPVGGSFSLMSLAHSYPSAAGPAVQWDGVSEGGPYRYNANGCSGPSPINNISTNLTTYNTLLLGSASPSSTRVHGMEFTVAGGADGQKTLTGTITLVACKRSGSSTSPVLDPTPDAERPRITLAFTATAAKMTQSVTGEGGALGDAGSTSREVRFDGEVTITGGTGVYEDVTGAGRMHGYLMCFAAEGVTAGDCAGGLFRDVGFTMTGWYRDPTVPELGISGSPSSTPPPGFSSSTPAWPAGPVKGSFGLKAMVHTLSADTPSGIASPKSWDGAAAGTYRYNARPCNDRAPVNDISTNLTTYNSRLPGSASPASTRNHSFEFTVPVASSGGAAPIEGVITLVACQRTGGPTAVNTPPDKGKPRIFVSFSGTATRTTTEEVRFDGEFDITGGTGVYEGLTGEGRIHGYLFCFNGDFSGGGSCRGGNLLDAQYTMTGWYQDPSVPELGVNLASTSVAFTDGSASSGQYGDQVLTEARLTDDQGSPIPGAELTYELADEAGARSWQAVTGVDGVAPATTRLLERPGPYRLSVRYSGQEGRYVGFATTTPFTVAKEDTVTSLSVEGTGSRTRLVARLVDQDTPSAGLAGKTVAFLADALPNGSATTDEGGTASITPLPPSYWGGHHLFEAVFPGDDYYLSSRDEEQT